MPPFEIVHHNRPYQSKGPTLATASEFATEPANIWVPPIRNRIDMLATGIKSPIGVKVSGSDLAELDRIAHDVETVARSVPGVSSALAERLTGGRYVDVDIDRAAAARFGLNIADVQAIVSGAIGGETIGETVEGLARYPISVRYPRELRDSLEGCGRYRS
jgi:Cu(I)/Ag(I) efflux system membrane protein CusA/SilA